MNKNILEIYNLIQELSWYFGNQGFDGYCCGDLSLVEFVALKKVHEKNNITVQEIGNALNITKSGASKIIDRLENKEYVLRIQSAEDGRVCCVAITDKGIVSITQIEEHYVDYVGEILIDFEPDTVNNAKKILELLVKSVRKHGFIKSTKIKKETISS